MGLLLHYPLTEDGVNKGFKTGTDFSGTFVDGILGNCLYANNVGFNSGLVFKNDCDYSKNSVTMTAWVKINKSELVARYEELKTSSTAWNSSYTTIQGSLLGLNSYGGLGLNFRTNALYNASAGTFNELTTLQLFGCVRGEASGGTGNVNIEFDKWFHVAFVFNRATMKMEVFINGVSKSTGTIPAALVTAHASASFRLNTGACYSGNAITASIPVYYNDVRLYDNALSKKEIYDLSKGLLLHYDFEIGNNLACIAGQEYAVEDTTHILWEGVPVLKLSQSGNTSTVYRGFSQTLYGLKAGDVVTLSAWIYTENKAGFDSGSEFRIYQTHNDGSANNWAGISWLSSQVDGKWCFHKKTYTLDSTLSTAVLNFNVVKNGTYWVTGLKVEYGDIATPYSQTLQAPGSTNVGYAKGSSSDTVGYLDPIMDVSGNNVETTSNQISIYGTDTIGYRAASFNGVYSFIKMDNFKKQLPNEPYTIAFWVYPREDKTRDVYFGNHNNSSQTFNLERNTSNYLRVYYNADTAIGPISAFTIPGSTWTHVVITFDGTTFYAYKNGSQVYSKALSTTLNCTNTTYKIGSDYRTAEGSVESNGTRLNGLMSDFRVYATALSSSDIKSLYESRKSIDRFGGIKVPVVYEDGSLSSSQILRNGIQKTPYISEIIELDDGSKWIQIMHHDNKNATNLFSSSDAVLTKSVFKNSDCWCDFPLINEIGLYDSKYEFFLVQEKYNGKFTRYRWSQTENPITATFDNTKYTSSGITQIENMPSTYGGMYKNTTGKTFFSMNNNTSSNWYGAIACYTSWSQTVSSVSYGGTPGIADSDSAVAVGVLDLWMRIDPANIKYRETRGGVILTNQIYEE